jgi:predicted NBD/HSP70 family sugar kinase
MNERAVYGEIFRRGMVSRPELAMATGLSKPTISVALGNLEREGLLRSVGLRAGGAGRSAVLYEVRPDAGWVLAVDIGRAYVRLALADLVGRIVARRQAPSRSSRAGDLIAQLTKLADEVVTEAGVGRQEITLAVFGTPGVHDRENGRLQLAPNLPGWNRAGAVQRFAEVAGPEFVVENDSDLAAMAEAAYGLGVGVSHFAYVSLGTGTGMGIMIDGRLYRGFQGAAGEISYLPIGAGDPVLNEPESRRRGMFESVAAADGIVAAARRLGMTHATTAKEVLDAARAGDRIAQRVVTMQVEYVANAIASVSAVLDPELVVLGGGIGAHAVDLLVGPVIERLRSMLALRPPRIEVSTLGTDGVLLGALAVGLSAARDLVFDRAVAGATLG